MQNGEVARLGLGRPTHLREKVDAVFSAENGRSAKILVSVESGRCDEAINTKIRPWGGGGPW